MITRIHSTTIIVSDQEKALEIYTGVLGWETEIDNEVGGGMRFLTEKPRGAPTGFALGQPEMHDGKPPGGAIGVSLIADDVGATYQELKAKGVNFTEAPNRTPWGAIGATFTDPDGNSFFLTEDVPIQSE